MPVKAEATQPEIQMEAPRIVADGPKRHGLRLQLRDKQLIATLAVARYLSQSQLQRLFFPSKYESTVRLRLAELSGSVKRSFPTPFLRRLQYRNYDGQLIYVWALTDFGYSVAESALGDSVRIPRKDVGAEFLEHAIALSELFVAVAGPFLSANTRVAHLPFRWSPTESVRLPWSQYDVNANQRRERLIVPDGVLEVAAAKRRFFIECEMGTHSIVAASDEKAGATLSKSERYEEFLSAYADSATRLTFYAQHYPDRWQPEVIFLVRSDARRNNVNEALKRWRQGRSGAAASRIRAQTLTDLEKEFAALAPPPAAKNPLESPAKTAETTDGSLVMHRQEVETLLRFYQESLKKVSRLKESRASAADYVQLARTIRTVLLRLGAAGPSKASARSSLKPKE